MICCVGVDAFISLGQMLIANGFLIPEGFSEQKY